MSIVSIDLSKEWYVVRANVRAEMKAAENIRKVGFDVYVPRQRIEKLNKRTHIYREIERPLMPGYLFVGMPKHNPAFGFVTACDGVERLLGEDKPMPVPATLVDELLTAEIDMQFDDTRAARIHRKEEARSKKVTIAMRFPVSSEWIVSDGPFSSFLATVEAVTNAGVVRALVNIFGRMTSVEFEPGQLSSTGRRKAA